MSLKFLIPSYHRRSPNQNHNPPTHQTNYIELQIPISILHNFLSNHSDFPSKTPTIKQKEFRCKSKLNSSKPKHSLSESSTNLKISSKTLFTPLLSNHSNYDNKKLIKENKRLKDENAKLKNIIRQLQTEQSQSTSIHKDKFTNLILSLSYEKQNEDNSTSDVNCQFNTKHNNNNNNSEHKTQNSSNKIVYRNANQINEFHSNINIIENKREALSKYRLKKAKTQSNNIVPLHTIITKETLNSIIQRTRNIFNKYDDIISKGKK
jgi:hypothetical protein